jgi:hypothetical protein
MITFDANGLDKLNEDLHKTSSRFISARDEALRRTGANTRQDLIKYIADSSKWGRLKPSTIRIKGIPKRFGSKSTVRVRQVSDTPHLLLTKLARYAVKTGQLHVFFGGGKKGEFGKLEPGITKLVQKIQSGRTWTVTKQMRKWAAANGVPFPSNVTRLHTKPRPIMPIFAALNKDKMVQRYNEKFEQIIIDKLSK